MNTNSSEFRLNHYDLFMNLVSCMHFVFFAILLELASVSDGNVELYNDAPTRFFLLVVGDCCCHNPQVHWYREEDQLYFFFSRWSSVCSWEPEPRADEFLRKLVRCDVSIGS